MFQSNYRFYINFAISLLLLSIPIVGHSNNNNFSPILAYQTVKLVQQEIELISKHKEAAVDSRELIPVENVYPREVYFQALTLRQKAGRLCHETIQSLFAPPLVAQYSIPSDISSKDVYEIVNDAWSQIRCAKAGLKIKEESIERTDLTKDSKKTLTDVFKQIVQANRQLNLILEQPIEQGDVYAIVEQANAYLIDILNKIAPVWSLNAPTLPAYQAGTAPIDSYNIMLRNFRIIQEIAKDSGIDMLDLGNDIQVPINTSDVFDLSSLILSELRFFASQIGVERIYKISSLPDKVAADVFQQAQFVEEHLKILNEFSEKFPAWTNLE